MGVLGAIDDFAFKTILNKAVVAAPAFAPSIISKELFNPSDTTAAPAHHSVGEAVRPTTADHLPEPTLAHGLAIH